EHRTAHCAGRARLHRSAACRRAHRPRRLRAAPADHGAFKAIVAANDRPAVRSGDRRAVSVLSDPRPDGPRLDLATQSDARHRARDGGGESAHRVTAVWLYPVIASEAKQSSFASAKRKMDCFVASLLAMTVIISYAAAAFSSPTTFRTAGRASMRSRW